MSEKTIPIHCQLCEYNFQNEYCQFNEKEEEFLDFSKCGEFSFCPIHLIVCLKNYVNKKGEI